MKLVLKFAVLLFFVISCSQDIQHGIIINEKDLNAIIPNLSRKADIKTILGEPSFIWKDEWYYISTKKKYKAFFMPKIVSHSAIVFSFDDQTLIKTTKYNEKDIQNKQITMHRIKFQKPNLTKIFK